jgi:hypothetical protein
MALVRKPGGDAADLTRKRHRVAKVPLTVLSFTSGPAPFHT